MSTKTINFIKTFLKLYILGILLFNTIISTPIKSDNIQETNTVENIYENKNVLYLFNINVNGSHKWEYIDYSINNFFNNVSLLTTITLTDNKFIQKMITNRIYLYNSMNIIETKSSSVGNNLFIVLNKYFKHFLLNIKSTNQLTNCKIKNAVLENLNFKYMSTAFFDSS